MKARFKGVFATEKKLFANKFSLFLYFMAFVVFALATLFFVANFTNSNNNPNVNTQIYRQQLEEVEKELEILDDPSLADAPVVSYDGRKEALLAQKELLLHYIQSGKTELDYIQLSDEEFYIEDIFVSPSSKGNSAVAASINMFTAYAICFALICLLRGIARMVSLCDKTKTKCRLLCDCSKKDLLSGGIAFDACILSILLIVFSLIRSIYASTGEVSGFYIINGASIQFGNIHELFFAQFIAISALGAVCYFFGALTATVANKARAFVAVLLCVVAIGIMVAIGFIAQYGSHDTVLWLTATPFLGISFCLRGFRYYVYFIHFALCVLTALPCAYFVFKRYRIKVFY